MSFTQTMQVQADGPEELVQLVSGWHRDQLGVAPGYQGARVLADQSAPGRYLIEVDFSDEEQAQQNNARPETQTWAESLRSIATHEPEYRNFTRAYASG